MKRKIYLAAILFSIFSVSCNDTESSVQMQKDFEKQKADTAKVPKKKI